MQNQILWFQGCSVTGMSYKHLHTSRGAGDVCMCNDVWPLFVPGLFEGVPGADRACAGHQPAAGPAEPAGERGPSRQQGQGAAGPVQHPHRCTRRQLVNCRCSTTSHTHHSCPSHQWTSQSELDRWGVGWGGGGVRELPVSSHCTSDSVTIYEQLEIKEFRPFFCPIHTRLGVFSPRCTGHI